MSRTYDSGPKGPTKTTTGSGRLAVPKIRRKDVAGGAGSGEVSPPESIDVEARLRRTERLGHGHVTPRAVTRRDDVGVQRVTASDYKDDTALNAMTLGELDRYAHKQADWAISTTLTNAAPFRSLLELARRDDGLVINGCGAFRVTDLLAANVGTNSAANTAVRHYSQAAGINKTVPTVDIQSPATTVVEAVAWGKALGKLLGAINGLILQRVVPQNATSPQLKALVDAGAVDDFVTYYTAIRPLLDATNGKEIISYLAFRAESANHNTYKTALPEIKNYHRFTREQLDALIVNKKIAKGTRPLSVMLQTAFDHNGAFHRDPFLTTVIKRTTHTTLVAEGETSLSAFGGHLAKFATDYSNDGKVDEIMLSGHGNAQIMEMAGSKGIGQNRANETIYGTSGAQPVKVGDTGSDTFVAKLISVLRDHADSRIVLNACLTASNSVSGTLDSDPVKAAQEIKNAIKADPSLATSIENKLKTAGQAGQVRGANASFGQVGLLDSSGRLDIASTTDPKLTAPKLEYAEEGKEPTGVLRATVEAWANNKSATIAALKRRIIATSSDKNWAATVIRALLKIVVAKPDDASLMNSFTGTAGVLGHLSSRTQCTVGHLKGKVPDAHMDAIFNELATTTLWSHGSFTYGPAVVYQVWMEKNSGKKASFVSFLTASALTTQDAASIIDLGHVKPLLDATLLPTTVPSPAPRGPFLLALLYLVRERASAPTACKTFLSSVATGSPKSFPSNSNVASILRGASQKRVLEDAGIVAPAVTSTTTTTTTTTAGPEPNVAPTGSGNNTQLVESVTLRARTYGLSSTNAYAAPGRTKVGTIPSGTDLHVIGKARGTKKSIFGDTPNVLYLAVEHRIKTLRTVFVRAGAVNMV